MILIVLKLAFPAGTAFAAFLFPVEFVRFARFMREQAGEHFFAGWIDDGCPLLLRRVAAMAAQLAADTAGMPKKPEQSKPIIWKVCKIASKAVWLGDVEAPDEVAAMEKAAAEFKVPATKLMAVPRR
jgi:hypothetical protein